MMRVFARPMRAALLAATIIGKMSVLALGGSLIVPVAALAACQPASYCATSGNCLSLAEIQSKAQARYGNDGSKVTRVRLRGHAPTETCLWFEVLITHPINGPKITYWRINGTLVE